MEGLNRLWFLAINSYAGHNHTLDFIIMIIAQYTPYLFIAVLFYLWFTKKRNEALYAGYAATLGVILNLIIGLFYFHPRPFMEGIGHALFVHKSENSFPSDHTTFLFSIAFMFLTFKSTRVLGIIAIIFSLMCGIGRIYSGVHWPFDIIGSIIVSAFVVSIINSLKNHISPLNKLIIETYDKILSRNRIA